MKKVLLVVTMLLAIPAGAQDNKSEPNAVERTAKKAVDATERTAKKAVGAVERTAKKVDKSLTNAAEKTDNWVKEKTK
jgi:hypothetical protein